MTIKELMENFDIQGAFHIKKWDNRVLDCVTAAKGENFECYNWDIDEEAEDALNSKIAYMYVSDDVLIIEVE